MRDRRQVKPLGELDGAPGCLAQHHDEPVCRISKHRERGIIRNYKMEIPTGALSVRVTRAAHGRSLEFSGQFLQDNRGDHSPALGIQRQGACPGQANYPGTEAHGLVG
jgi:hypothetical protein